MTATLTVKPPSDAAPGLPAGRLYQIVKYFRKNGALLLLALPGLIHIFMIQYMPMFGMVIAFKDYKFADGIFGSKTVWFENFRFLFATDVAWRITFNTLLMNALFIVSGTLASLTWRCCSTKFTPAVGRRSISSPCSSRSSSAR